MGDNDYIDDNMVDHNDNDDNMGDHKGTPRQWCVYLFISTNTEFDAFFPSPLRVIT